jgi:hypothetical protein
MIVILLHNGGAKLANYRLYRLDGAGKIASAEWIEAAADDEALREAQSRADTARFELWHKNRLVRQPGTRTPPIS